jgi:hypothetical protein
MYARTGDILQFVYNDCSFDEDNINSPDRLKYGFLKCKRDTIYESQSIEYSINGSSVTRDFHRYNVVKLDTTLGYIRDAVELDHHDYGDEYYNRPYSELFELINDEGIYDED